MTSDTARQTDPEQAIAATRAWLHDVVVALNLCPFAAAPLRRNAIRYRVSMARDPQSLSQDLLEELIRLDRDDPAEIATTLLIVPYTLEDFADYNDFLDLADAALRVSGLEGVLQIASFHPDYCFADSAPDDLANYTNRSPYPLLHILREDEVERAVALHPDTERIPRDNIRRLEGLGMEKITALLASCQAAAE